MLALQTILHPTDFSEHSEHAFWLACSLARDHGARLIVLHAVHVPTVSYGEGVIPPDPELFVEAARKHIDQLPLAEAGVATERRVIEGDVVEELLRAAEETKADLIVMGTHGRTGLTRLLMGSVAEEVVRRAPCPVLTVRTPSAATRPAERALAGVGAAE